MVVDVAIAPSIFYLYGRDKYELPLDVANKYLTSDRPLHYIDPKGYSLGSTITSYGYNVVGWQKAWEIFCPSAPLYMHHVLI